MSLIKRFTTPNVGSVDRLVRALPFLATVGLWLAGVLSGPALIIAGVVSAMLLLTSIMGLCSIYAMLGISTRRAR